MEEKYKLPSGLQEQTFKDWIKDTKPGKYNDYLIPCACSDFTQPLFYCQ